MIHSLTDAGVSHSHSDDRLQMLLHDAEEADDSDVPGDENILLTGDRETEAPVVAKYTGPRR
jgi:hypothetical protein